jgi:hypothetical protein
MEHHDAELNFAERMGYADYLALDRVLDAQHPLSDAHDELLFIIQHQTSELWMKLAVHELESARDAILSGALPQAFKLLARVSRILEQLNGAWDVLRTMTPSDYTTFRDALGQSSGFQSWQYRAIEYLCGNRTAATLGPHRHRPVTLGWRRSLPHPASTTRRSSGSTPPGCSAIRRATGATRMSPTRRSPPPGRRSTAIRPPIGRSTNSPRSWSTSRIISAAGASTTSRRWSA